MIENRYINKDDCTKISVEAIPHKKKYIFRALAGVYGHTMCVLMQRGVVSI
jgi:hypothetical protein